MVEASEATSTADVDVDELRGLLRSYRQTLQRSERLPTILWMRTRPRGSAPFAGWLRLPRLTWGTSLLVLHHVSRSVDALSRAYAARAALGELDERGLRERQMLTDFRASLRPVKWQWFVIGSVVATVLVGKLLVEGFARSVQLLAPWLPDESSELKEDQLAAVRDAFSGLTAIASSLSDSSSLANIEDQLVKADASALMVLVATLLVAAYLVLRPVSTAFRMKRILFNLADTPEETLRRTTSTWHVRRAVGLYDRERRVLATTGSSWEARERPLDLMLSMLITLVLGWVWVSVYLGDGESVLGDRLLYAAIVMPIVVARLVWLGGAYASRRDTRRRWKVPTGTLLPATSRIVDVRSAVETAIVALLFSPIVWYRQARQLADLRAEVRAQSLSRPTGRLHPMALLLAAPATFWPLPFWPFLFLGRAWNARGLASRGWAVAALWALIVFPILWLIAVLVLGFSAEQSATWYVSAFFEFLLAPVSFGMAQALHNTIVRKVAHPLPYDVAPTGSELRPPRFNTPASWPPPPAGWRPFPGWRPDPTWTAPPPDWRFWSQAETSDVAIGQQVTAGKR